MTRIRTIKPEILEDDKTAGLSDAASRLFHGVIVLADDHGRLRGSPEWLRARVFWARPEHSASDVEAMLAELDAAGLVICYTVAGQDYLAIKNWAKHQRISNAGKPRCPGPDDSAAVRRESPRVAASLGDSPPDPDHDHDQRTPTTNTDSPRAAAEVSVSSGQETDTRVGDVVEHYRQRFPKRLGQAQKPETRALVRARLAEGYSVDDLCLAIDGNADTPFYRDKGLTELRRVMESAESVDKFMQLARAGPEPPRGGLAGATKKLLNEWVNDGQSGVSGSHDPVAGLLPAARQR